MRKISVCTTKRENSYRSRKSSEIFEYFIESVSEVLPHQALMSGFVIIAIWICSHPNLSWEYVQLSIIDPLRWDIDVVSSMLAFLTRIWRDILLYLLCDTRVVDPSIVATHTRLHMRDTQKHIVARTFGCGNVTTINLGWKNNAFPRRVLYKYPRQLCVRWTLQINRLTCMNHIFRSFAIADGGRYRSACICLYICLHCKKNKHFT